VHELADFRAAPGGRGAPARTQAKRAPDVASPPLAIFLPDGRAVAMWAAGPHGEDPSQGIGTTSVLGIAVRPADSL